jgi:hypothetical protein
VIRGSAGARHRTSPAVVRRAGARTSPPPSPSRVPGRPATPHDRRAARSLAPGLGVGVDQLSDRTPALHRRRQVLDAVLARPQPSIPRLPVPCRGGCPAGNQPVPGKSGRLPIGPLGITLSGYESPAGCRGRPPDPLSIDTPASPSVSTIKRNRRNDGSIWRYVPPRMSGSPSARDGRGVHGVEVWEGCRRGGFRGFLAVG